MMTAEEFSKKTKDLGFCFMSKRPNDNASFLECDEGWYELIYNLCKDLKEAGFDGHVDQIKEKFGGLRFYISYGDNTTDEVAKKCDKLIMYYEDSSIKTCETCGQDGEEVNLKGWIKTLCGGCFNKWKVKNSQK